MSDTNIQTAGRITAYHVMGIWNEAKSVCLNLKMDAESSSVSLYLHRDEAETLAKFLTTAVAEYDAEHAKVAA